MKDINRGLKYLVCTVICAGALYRLIPHVPNFTPVTAIALFSGAYLVKRSISVILPIAILFISDFALNNTVLRVWFPDNEGLVWFSSYMIPVYFSFIIINILGSRFIQKNDSIRNIGAGLLGSSVLFFIITNFGSWMTSPIYTKNFVGLTECYVAAIPFFRGTLIGDLVFGVLFFGSYKLAKHFLTKRALVNA